MEKTYFISDLHFGHYNILKHKPFRKELAGISENDMLDKELAIKKHDTWLINLWNSVIKNEDVVYILGDFSFGDKEYTAKILNKLNGKKHLVFGNHDQSCKGENERFFITTSDIKEIKFKSSINDFIDDKNGSFCIEACHYPLFTWNRRTHGSCHLHGHCHGGIDRINKESNELRFDVGLDGEFSNYTFKTVEDVYNEFMSIVNKFGFSTFQEYINFKMEKDGFRM